MLLAFILAFTLEFLFLFLLLFEFAGADSVVVVPVAAPVVFEFPLPCPQVLKNRANDRIRIKLTALNINPPSREKCRFPAGWLRSNRLGCTTTALALVENLVLNNSNGKR